METILTKIDWNTFQCIFSLNTRDAFQKLAEQLFCFEFHQPYGIYRYYNQPYIETMPIQYEGDFVGFQAKFFDAQTNLSDKSGELIAALSGAHKKYPIISKIVFYINKEPGMSTENGKEKPQYILDVENHGNSFGIEVEWRGLSQIETMLMRPEMRHIRDYFFCANGGIRQFTAQVEQHKAAIFDSIASEIPYGGQSIKIKRDMLSRDSFFASEEDILLLYGDGGSGKSGLVKEQFAQETEFPVWLFRATDLDCASIPEFSRKFGDCIWDEVLSAFDSASRKLVIIDSAEKVFSIEHQDTLESVISSLRRHGWKVIVTIRTSYRLNFQNVILKTSKVLEYPVQKLTETDLMLISQRHGFSLPESEAMRGFLCNLFYLKLYLSKANVSANSVEEFLKNVWKQVICNASNQRNSLHIRRDKAICMLVQSNVENRTLYWIPTADTDWDAISALSNDGIIQLDEVMGGYFITHDVYEEIVLNHIITREYRNRQNAGAVFLSIGDSLTMRKAFRIWLHKQLGSEDEGIGRFLAEVLMDEIIDLIWKDEILIALMSEEGPYYPRLLDDVLKEHEFILFIRALNLLNTACKVVDEETYKKIVEIGEYKDYSRFRFTKPYGYGWKYLIPYTYENRHEIPWSPVIVMLVADALYAWNHHSHMGETTRASGLLALYLYQKSQEEEYRYRLGEDKIGRICDAILQGSQEILPELTQIVQAVIADTQFSHQSAYADLCEHMLKNAFDCGTICYSAPELVIQLLKHLWLADGTEAEYYHSSNILADFGLARRCRHEYYPASAFQTPVLPLLQAAPIKTMDFIIELFDITTESYKNSHLNRGGSECSEIELVFPNGKRTIQTVSERLWKMYRGTHAAPNLLESVLMALERWLYECVSIIPEKSACNICTHLLLKSHSAAITAVVTSIVTAYPEKLFPIACVLLHTREIFTLDIRRLVNEYSADFLRGLSPNQKLYDNERIKSNALPFRKRRLEEVIMDYQLNRGSLSENEFQARLDKLYRAIDEAFPQGADLEDREQFVLYRIDLRKMKAVRGQVDDRGQQILLVPDLPEKLVKSQNVHNEEQKNINQYQQLFCWCHERFEHREKEYQKYHQYEENPVSALEDALKLLSNSNPIPLPVDGSILIYISSVLLTDFKNRLDDEKLGICEEIIVEYLQSVIEQQDVRAAGDGTDAAIAALPVLLELRESYSFPDAPAILFLMLICDWGKQRDWAVVQFREKVWGLDSDLAWKILRLFIIIKGEYDEKVSKPKGLAPFAFLEEHSMLIKSVLEQPSRELPNCSHLSEIALQTMTMLLPAELNETCAIVLDTGRLFWKDFFSDRRKRSGREKFRDYDQEHNYLVWLSEYLLLAKKKEQISVLSELIPCLAVSKITDTLLTRIIFCQDQLKKPLAFWRLWKSLFVFVEQACESKKPILTKVRGRGIERYYGDELDKIVTTYLLAFPWWSEGTRSWHTLGEENASFFAKAALSLGYHPGTLYSIARVLNTVGYGYLNSGVKWLAEIIRNNPHLRSCTIEINTEYNIEEVAQRFITANRVELKRNSEMRKDLLDILNFLVDRGSTYGFILRESVC